MRDRGPGQVNGGKYKLPIRVTPATDLEMNVNTQLIYRFSIKHVNK